MAGYVIADVQVTDEALFDEYRKLVPGTVAAYGGKYLVRGGEWEVREGEWTPTRTVVLQFDSVERAREWYDSPEYARAQADADQVHEQQRHHRGTGCNRLGGGRSTRWNFAKSLDNAPVSAYS